MFPIEMVNEFYEGLEVQVAVVTHVPPLLSHLRGPGTYFANRG